MGSVPNVVAIGETMVVLVPAGRGPLAASESLAMHVGGAESNVAGLLADLGFRASWPGIVGDDPFGEVVLSRLAARGIGLGSATLMPGQRTGFYIKELPLAAGGKTTVHYARSGSRCPASTPSRRTARCPTTNGPGCGPARADGSGR